MSDFNSDFGWNIGIYVREFLIQTERELDTLKNCAECGAPRPEAVVDLRREGWRIVWKTQDKRHMPDTPYGPDYHVYFPTLIAHVAWRCRECGERSDLR